MAENQIPPLFSSSFLQLPASAGFYNNFYMSAHPGYMTQPMPSPTPTLGSNFLSQLGGNFIDFGASLSTPSSTNGINFGSPPPTVSTESCKSGAFGGNIDNSGGKSPGDTGFDIEMSDDCAIEGNFRGGNVGDGAMSPWKCEESQNFQGHNQRNFGGTPYARPNNSQRGNPRMNRGSNRRGLGNMRGPSQYGPMKLTGPARHPFENFDDPPPPPLMGSFTVAISGLPPCATEASIGANFSSVGSIKIDHPSNSPKIYLEKDPSSGACLGRCLITYNDYEGAQSAVACFDGKEFQGNIISVMMNPNDLRAAYENQNRRLNNQSDGFSPPAKAFRGTRGGLLTRRPGNMGPGGPPRGMSNRGAGNPAPRSASNNNGVREGDWVCYDPACGNRNFAFRSECHRCGLPKPSGFNHMSRGGGGGRGGRPGRSNMLPLMRPRGNRGGGGGGGGGGPRGGGRAFRGSSRGRPSMSPY